MWRQECRFAGYGGQGIILMGIILGAAAVIDQKNAAQTQSYGPEARGGSARSDVVISDEKIDCLLVTKPSILVAMSQEAFDKYATNLSSDYFIWYDPGTVDVSKNKENGRYYAVPATQVATEEFGKKIVANMVMLGAMVGGTNLVSNEALRKALILNVPEKSLELNVAALSYGLDLGKSMKK